MNWSKHIYSGKEGYNLRDGGEVLGAVRKAGNFWDVTVGGIYVGKAFIRDLNSLIGQARALREAEEMILAFRAEHALGVRA